MAKVMTKEEVLSLPFGQTGRTFGEQTALCLHSSAEWEAYAKFVDESPEEAKALLLAEVEK